MRIAFAAVCLVLLSAVSRSEEAPMLAVWPAEVPGEKGGIGEELVQPSKPGEKQVERLTNVSHPTVTVYKPAAASDTGAAVLICPGGGYHILAMDLEGKEVADWLNSIGITGIVLKYRVPRREGQEKHVAPLQDAQRGMSLVRSRAPEWKIDPARIGILGFSAGGHLAAVASTNFDRRQYAPIDDIDQISCRPDFTVLIYPAYLAEGLNLLPEIRVSADTPPVFFVHAGDDRISPENSISMYLALKAAGVPAELHIFGAGGHGFGLRPSEHPVSKWPVFCEQWMRSRGLVE